MVPYYGDFAEDDTVHIPFNTFSSDDPSASVTITNLADADIMVHKDAGLTQIATDGATVTINFDSITGNHMIAIDTSASADYSTGSEYHVRVEGTTVDGATINAWIGAFSIERAGGALAVAKLIQTAVITNAVGADVSADIATMDANVDAILVDTATLGAPVGADFSADIAAIKAETALIVADTNELQTDWADAGRLDAILDARAAEATVAALNNISAADVNAQVVDVLKTDTVAELAGVPSATPTLEDAIMWMYMMSRNLRTTTATVDTVTNDAGTGIATSAVSDDATTFTRAEYV
jgi:hypothetical protein